MMKYTCSNCGKKIRRFYNIDKCYNCYQENKKIIRFDLSLSGTEKEELNKVRIIKNFKGQRVGTIYVPRWMAGLKVKLVKVKE